MIYAVVASTDSICDVEDVPDALIRLKPKNLVRENIDAYDSVVHRQSGVGPTAFSISQRSRKAASNLQVV
ncbi:hypothetical protein GWI33_016551 [Rhynchophorus ferrugineus]|uniref:Uncharacterized protein n=1 Tax=Rhynchophorus ferrugineus TaxID=354439 RepID=A0A834HZU9_RHYFE|nr:hypothetical protein GWI33_016551 [Rhynchophorus ferrugineus]